MKAKFNLIYMSLAVFAVSALTLSCDEDSKDVSVITYYVDIDLAGDNPMGVKVGTPFTDPGFTASEQGVELPEEEVTVSGRDIDTSEQGYAEVTYSAINSDGYPISIVRQVFITEDYYDGNNANIEGDWVADLVRNNDGAVQADDEGYDVTIKKVPTVPGVYEISDLLGGWYDQRAGYGSGYAARGYIQINTDLSVFIYTSLIQGWGSYIVAQPDTEYDPDTETITLNVKMNDAPLMLFTVTLTRPVED